MGIFSFFRSSPPARSADKAKERLQLLLALERKSSTGLDFLPQLQDDLIKVISKYVQIDNDKVSIGVERGTDYSVLDINIELPSQSEVKPARRPLTPSPAPAT